MKEREGMIKEEDENKKNKKRKIKREKKKMIGLLLINGTKPYDQHRKKQGLIKKCKQKNKKKRIKYNKIRVNVSKIEVPMEQEKQIF